MRGSKEITNSQDVIDSRNIIERIDYLQLEREALVEASEATEHSKKIRTERKKELDDFDESDEGLELKALLALQEQADCCADWKHGAALIRDSYFKEYAQEFADDIGAINKDAGWPLDCIDWDQAVDALKMDYSSVEFDGEEYWVRS